MPAALYQNHITETNFYYFRKCKKRCKTELFWYKIEDICLTDYCFLFFKLKKIFVHTSNTNQNPELINYLITLCLHC